MHAFGCQTLEINGNTRLNPTCGRVQCGWLAAFTSCFGLWSESGSGDSTSGSGCWSPGSLTTKTTKRKRRTSDDVVFSSFGCCGHRPRCPTCLDPCCLAVSWQNKQTNKRPQVAQVTVRPTRAFSSKTSMTDQRQQIYAANYVCNFSTDIYRTCSC